MLTELYRHRNNFFGEPRGLIFPIRSLVQSDKEEIRGTCINYVEFKFLLLLCKSSALIIIMVVSIAINFLSVWLWCLAAGQICSHTRQMLVKCQTLSHEELLFQLWFRSFFYALWNQEFCVYDITQSLGLIIPSRPIRFGSRRPSDK